MKFPSQVVAVLLAGSSMIMAQVPLASSHAPAAKAPAAAAAPAPTAKPAVRVNDAVLTDIDVTREMYAMFPYANQHQGFPKGLEPEIRKGAIQMVIFEELLYQEAKRRNLAIAAERLTRAEVKVRRGFPSKALFDQYLRVECNGSKAVLREKIRRSMLIEQMLKTEVAQKSAVTPAELRAYYNKNVKQYSHGEAISFQTISMIPPANATAAMKQEAYDKIKDALRLAREAKDSKAFGLLAEQISDDDWRTHLGDRGSMELTKLPPEIVKAAAAMKPGDVSDVIKLGDAYTIIRLNGRAPAGTTSFQEVKTKLRPELEKQKKEQVRSALNQQLRKTAKIEVL